MSDNKQHVTIQLLPGSTVLTILFVLLKVYDKIDWSWWWVFAPMWIPFAIIGVIILAMAILAGIVAIIE